jgi:hypothetical protein
MTVAVTSSLTSIRHVCEEHTTARRAMALLSTFRRSLVEKTTSERMFLDQALDSSRHARASL